MQTTWRLPHALLLPSLLVTAINLAICIVTYSKKNDIYLKERAPSRANYPYLVISLVMIDIYFREPNFGAHELLQNPPSVLRNI